MAKITQGLFAAFIVLVSMPALVVSQEAVAQEASATSEMLLPPNAKPGECYARVFIPPAYKTETEKVLKQEASKEIEIVPPEYKWVEEKVLVKEASYKLEVIPAEYGWVEEKVMVKPVTYKIEEVPAVYGWVEEKVIDKPAHTVWKEGRGPVEKIDNATGEIMCLVEVPATYKIVKQRVVKKPASTDKMEIPAEYKIVKKQVVKTEPSTRKVEIPAEYKTVKVRKLVSEAQVNEIPIPEEYDTVTKTEKISEGKMEWRSILCETNVTPEVVTSIQQALQTAGYYEGPIDGIFGTQTVDGIRSFQKAKGLATGGVTMEALKELGISL